MNILAIGDTVGDIGVSALEHRLRDIKKKYQVDFAIVNGENSAGVGITASLAHRIYNAGADVITLGNHVWGKKEIANFLDDDGYILRPANLAPIAPGRGHGIFHVKSKMICVINLQGRCNMDFGPDNPFTCVTRLLKETARLSDFTVVDFHASATSEKIAMAYHLDGKASALWGTHTHVPTADERVFPKGTGYITDLGMTGAVESVLGIRPEQSVESFLGGLPGRYRPAEGPCKAQGALFTLESSTGLCTAVERVEIR